MLQVVVIWKKNDKPFLPLPHSHLPRKYLSTSSLYYWYLWVNLWLWNHSLHISKHPSVEVTTLLTYFLPLLSVTRISSTWNRGPLLPNEEQTAEGVHVSVMKALGVPGISSLCLGKKTGCILCVRVSLFHLDVKLSFHIDPLNCGWGALCSLSTPKWNLLSKLKVLWIVP